MVRGEDFLEINSSETRIVCGGHLYRGLSIDASYQVSVHMAERFHRRRLKCEKLTDDRCQVMAKAHTAFGETVMNN